MFYVIVHTDKGGKDHLYIVKAESIEQACSVVGLSIDDTSHCAVTKDTIECLSGVNAGYVKFLL